MQIYQYLCNDLSSTKEDIYRSAISAPNKYKVYTIPKRSSGTRTIAHPSRKLKILQRSLTKYLETLLPVSDSAYAYKKNTGIKNNAAKHKHSRYLLKMDFQNFFHNINPTLLFIIIKRLGIELSKDDIYLLTKLLFWSPSKLSEGKLILSIGAPSSPFISNVIMFFFDQAINEKCIQRNITYTRYADDLTFSTNRKNILFDIPLLVKTILKEQLEGFISINESKTVFSSMAHNRHVTGVTLTNTGTLSIGRDRKRYISSLVHKFSLNILEQEDIMHLQGLLAFAKDIEPAFETRLINKYSIETINNIFKMAKVK